MKFRGNRQSLLEALTIVGSVVAPRSIKPILQNLRMVVDSSGATLLATDLEHIDAGIEPDNAHFGVCLRE